MHRWHAFQPVGPVAKLHGTTVVIQLSHNSYCTDRTPAVVGRTPASQPAESHSAAFLLLQAKTDFDTQFCIVPLSVTSWHHTGHTHPHCMPYTSGAQLSIPHGSQLAFLQQLLWSATCMQHTASPSPSPYLHRAAKPMYIPLAQQHTIKGLLRVEQPTIGFNSTSNPVHKCLAKIVSTAR